LVIALLTTMRDNAQSNYGRPPLHDR